MRATLLILALSLLVASCGVKNQLSRPDSKPVAQDEPDPSRPPYPLGR